MHLGLAAGWWPDSGSIGVPKATSLLPPVTVSLTYGRLVEKLAKLTSQSSSALAYELDVERVRFDRAWKRERPELPAAMFAVIGPAVSSWFDPIELSAPDEPPLPVIEPLPALSDGIGEIPISPTP